MPEKITGPVTIRGRTFASREEAARELGVTIQQVHNAIRKGRINTLGIGSGVLRKANDPARTRPTVSLPKFPEN